MNEYTPFTFLTAFSKSRMPLILTDISVSSILSINSAALEYLRDLRIYITSSRELINILQPLTEGKMPPSHLALEYQTLLQNSVHQFIEVTIDVQQESLSGKPVLLFSILGSTQITDPQGRREPLPAEITSPIFLVGITPEGIIEYVNRSVAGINMDQILGSKIDAWTFVDRFGDIHYYEQAIATEQSVIYDSMMMGPNGIPLESRIYLTPVFEQEALTGFIIATTYINKDKLE